MKDWIDSSVLIPCKMQLSFHPLRNSVSRFPSFEMNETRSTWYDLLPIHDAWIEGSSSILVPEKEMWAVACAAESEERLFNAARKQSLAWTVRKRKLRPSSASKCTNKQLFRRSQKWWAPDNEVHCNWQTLKASLDLNRMFRHEVATLCFETCTTWLRFILYSIYSPRNSK